MAGTSPVHNFQKLTQHSITNEWEGKNNKDILFILLTYEVE